MSRLPLLTLVLALALLPSSAFAAGSTYGRLIGRVTDASGVPLAELDVTLTGPALQQPMRRITNADGRFEFPLVPPGEGYVLACDAQVFAPFEKRRVAIRLGLTTVEDIRLELLEGGEESIVVVGNPNPILDSSTVQSGAVITSEKAAATPIFAQVQALPQLSAGVGPGSTPVLKGGLARYGKYYVDGMDTTDISDGSFTAPHNFYAVENFEILTGGLDAQYNALGIVQNLVTKTGSNRFTVDALVLASPSWVNPRAQFGSRQPPAVGQLLFVDRPSAETSFYSPMLNVGGPIVPDRLWFYVSTQLNLSHRETPLSAEENRPTDTVTQLGRVKLTWQPTAADRLSIGLNLDRNTIENSIANTSVTADAESRTARGGYFLIANYDRSLSEKVLLVVQAGTTSKQALFSPVTDAISHTERNASVTRFSAPRLTGEEANELREDKVRWQVDTTLLATLGNHELKGGLQLGYLAGRKSAWVLGGQRFLDRGGVCDPNNPATFSYCDTLIDFYNTDDERAPQVTDATVQTYGLFVQDRFRLGDRLSILAGLRGDLGRLYADDGQFLDNLLGLGPRAGVTYDVQGNQRTLLKVGYGRSNDIGDVFLAQQGNPSLVSVERRWTGAAFATCAPGSTEQGCTTRGGLSGFEFTRGQRPPSVDEVTLGVHQAAGEALAVGLDLTYRRYANLWIDEEVNRLWDASGTRVLGYANGQAQTIYVIRTSPEAWREYRGADLWVQGDAGPWNLLASYTLGFNDGTVGGYLDNFGDNPRMRFLFEGPTSDDVRHTLKGAIGYRLWFGMDLGVRFQYRTGTPGWMYQRNPGASSEQLYRSPRGTGHAFTPGGQPDFNDPAAIAELRNPDQVLFDVQARYDLGKPLGLSPYRVELFAQLFNILNTTAPTRYENEWSRTNFNYGTVASRQSAMQIQAGMRVRN